MLIAMQDFCVFSCKGVSQLRTYLTELFDRITEMNNTDDTEYEEDDFDAEAYQEDDTPEPEFFGETRGVEGYPRQNILINPIMTTPRGGSRFGPSAPGLQQPSHEFTFQLDQPTGASTSPVDARDGRQMGEISSLTNLHGATSRLNAQITASTPTLQPRLLHGHPQHIRSVADVLPVVESPISPPPSDVASNHSIRTNNSNGAGFFRVYHERPAMSVSPQGYGALTPDLNYAEIGHGRGAQPGPTDTGPTARGSFVRSSTGMQHNLNPDRTPRQPTIVPPHVTQEAHPNSTQGSSEPEEFTDRTVRHNISVAADKSWSYHEPSLTSPTTRELQASVQSALGVERRGRREQPESTQNAERRARSVKRSIRNTFHAAEHYASSLLFGRNSEDTQVEGSNSGSGMASGSRSHPS
jgi:F-box and leucine-rich repeat protein GRR1